jgi:Protein of unknown function (DUF1588)
MCTPVEAAPNDVNTTLPVIMDGTPETRTTRERIAEHISNDGCYGCHTLMDPLGFLLEGIDQHGKTRDTEQGLPIDESGEVDGFPFVGAAGLGSGLSDQFTPASCLVRGLFRQATSHIETDGESPSLYEVDIAFLNSGFSLQEAMVAIVTSDAFLFVSSPESP